jgi:uncharacterized membrane protein YfcA
MGETISLTLLILIAALLYSSVGHGGASGYLAAMALFNLAPVVMKPSALVLNLLVAGLGTYRYGRAGYFDPRIFWPFAALSIPFAALGGALHLPPAAYRVILGLVLFFAAWRLAIRQSARAMPGRREIPRGPALAIGAGIGLLSGLTGVGGGIFLSPILLLTGWADPRKAAGVSAAFILVNSAAGLAGHWQSVRAVPSEILWWGPAALAGGIIGTGLGSRRLTPMGMRRMLAAVLVIAGAKMLLSAR